MAKKDQEVQEAGGSLNDYIQKVSMAFENAVQGYVIDVFEDSLIASVGDYHERKTYRISYTMDENEDIIFAPMDDWQEVMLDWSPVGGEGDMAEGEISESLRGSVELVEADGKKFAEAVIIVEGESANGNVYVTEALQTGVGVFSGARMYADHPSRSEESDRPERSVRDLVGKLGEAYLSKDKNGKAALRAKMIFSETAGWLETLVREGIAGDLSIRAYGNGKEDKNGRFVVSSFSENPHTSVDFVTVGAAGGYVDLTESARDGFWSGITKDEIRKHRPDLIEAEAEEKTVALVENNPTPDPSPQAERGDDTTLQEAYDALIEEVKELRAGRLESALTASGLPEAARERIRESWDGESDPKALIEAERQYLAKIVRHGAPVGIAASRISESKAKEAETMLHEAMKDLLDGNDEAAKIAVKGRE